MALNELSLSELVRMLKNGETSPHEVAKDLVSAIDAHDATIQAYTDVHKDELLSSAKRMTASGGYRDTVLCGVPVSIKDNINVKGRPTTCASRILAGYDSLYDATVVLRLRQAGALIAGKTNMDEFAMGSSTENSAFGPTRNPWNPDYTPGGSSGGSAAAVAADTAIAALGSDTGGSIRQPASLCGTIGLKPTYGRVSRYGLVAFASSLDQIGPIGKTVADCALLLGVIAGEDPLDSTSVAAAVPDFTDGLDKGLEGLTLGVPWDFVEGGMDEEVSAGFDGLMRSLERANVEIVDVALPHAKYAVACYYIIANAEASSNLARFDGVKYGYRTENHEDLYSMYTRTRKEGFGDEVKRRILLGTYVLSAGFYDAYYRKAQKVRSLIIRDMNQAFDRCDLIMLPTSPTPAFKIGEKISDPLRMYLSDKFTVPGNLAGAPCVSVPIGLSSARLPLGVQLVGRVLDEPTVLRGARGVERLVDFKEKALGHV